MWLANGSLLVIVTPNSFFFPIAKYFIIKMELKKAKEVRNICSYNHDFPPFPPISNASLSNSARYNAFYWNLRN